MIYKNQNTMRKGILLIFTVLATLVGCGQYDDSELKSDINDLKSRMAALEKQCKNMNENLTSLQAIVDAIQKQDGIVSVTDLPDGQGYSVKFVSGKVIYLYNGKNGTDGVTPKISVRKDSDGIYYWTVDGDWLMVDGKKVRAVGLDGKDGKDGEDGQDGQDGKDAITPQLKIVEGFWYISYDNGKSWNKLGKATGENGKDGQDGKDGDGFFKSVTVKDGYAIFVMNDSEQTTLRIPVAVVSAVSSIKYVPESLDGIVKVRYSKIGGKNVPVDIVIMFEVMPQGAVDYIVKNWKEVLTAKAIYASSTKASIGDFVTMNIKDVVGGEDNIIVVTINAKSLDDLFFSTDIPVAANLRLAVKMNGSESISSDYLPLSPLLSYDQIIEYTTVTGDRIDYGSLFEFKRGDSALSLTDSHVGNAWRIYIEGSPVERNLFSCIFNKRSYDDNNGNYNYDLKSLSFVTPIELEALSFSESGSLILADLSNVNTENVIDMFRMFQGCYSLTSLDLSSLDTRNVTNMGRMFGVCSALTNLDLSGFDTRNVTNMSEMFFYCTSLASLGLSSFDTRNVTDMKRMFEECHSLTSLDLSSFYTRDVANMNRMFLNCKSLTSLDLSSFDTRNVTDMEFMFGGCSSLTSLDLSSFDARSVTNMYCMFSGCSALASLDLSSFDTKNVTDMSLMFQNCQSLTSLDLSSFDTKNVTDMPSMFQNCQSLTSLDLSSFDTKNVTDMNYMFSSCSSLVSLDLSGFDTKNVTGMYCMFYDCNSLTSLNLSNFSISENCLVSGMFHNCTNLKEIIMRGCDKTTIEMISKEKPEGAVIITD
jgi:surface protein